MDTPTSVAPQGSAPAPIVNSTPAPAAAPAAEYSASDAAKALAERRWTRKGTNQQVEPAQSEAAPEPPLNQLADEANAAPQNEAPSEDASEIDSAENLPPIDAPRSWTADVKERWSALPRDVQEEVARIEQSRERELRRSQNEAAEKLKGLSAKEQEVEKARQEYEAKLPAIMQVLQSKGEFADIRTLDDVKKMAMEDPFRKLQWDVHQQELQAVAYEMQQADQRSAAEKQSKWTQHVQEENSKAAELIPELADPVKSKALQTAAVELLHDKGFTDQELNRLASGEERISVYDHRLQSLLLDGVKWRDANKAKTAVTAKPTPPVVRPGVAKPAANSNASKIQALEKQLSQSSGVQQARVMAEIRQLRKAGTR